MEFIQGMQIIQSFVTHVGMIRDRAQRHSLETALGIEPDHRRGGTFERHMDAGADQRKERINPQLAAFIGRIKFAIQCGVALADFSGDSLEGPTAIIHHSGADFRKRNGVKKVAIHCPFLFVLQHGIMAPCKNYAALSVMLRNKLMK